MAAPVSTVEAILRCAHTLVIAGGYNGFSYADIADVVGIRKSSIHHYFPTKADLVHALVRQYRAEAEAGIAEIERQVDGPLSQLTSYTNYWESCIGAAESGCCLCALLATQLSVIPDEVVSEVRAHFQELSTWLASALERGARDGSMTLAGSARSVAEMLIAVVHGAMLSARAHGDPRVFAAITRVAIDGLRSHPAGPESRLPI